MTEKFSLKARVIEDQFGQRLDQAAAQLFPDFSRARLQTWIKNARLLVNGEPGKAKDRLMGGEILTLDAELDVQEHWQPENLPLNTVYRDEAIIVINKPVGLVVHPAAGNRTGTLLNALLFHYPELETVPRAGIVHRLDKDTSGLMVVARTQSSHLDLVTQLQERSISRGYQAIVSGLITAGGTVDAPLGRHPVHRTRRAVLSSVDAREAITHYRILTRFRSHTHIQLKLETGRTHQIRVHMSHIAYPLVGDQVYAGRLKLPKGASTELIEFLKKFKRQALHACHLGLKHPKSGKFVEWKTELPEDMLGLLQVLQNDCG